MCWASATKWSQARVVMLAFCTARQKSEMKDKNNAWKFDSVGGEIA